MPDELTESFVKEIEPPETGAITVWDSKITGFGVRVFAPTNRRPQGARSFFINYRIGGREKRFTIGSFPEWSAKAARNEAKELRRRIDKGDDPASKKRERREAPTVADLAERYRTEHLPKKAESSQANDWAMIKNEILPRLGSRKVAEVHHGDIEALASGNQQGPSRSRQSRPRGSLENVLPVIEADGRRRCGLAQSCAGQSMQGRRAQSRGRPRAVLQRSRARRTQRCVSSPMGRSQPAIAFDSSCSPDAAQARRCRRHGSSSTLSLVSG